MYIFHTGIDKPHINDFEVSNQYMLMPLEALAYKP